MDSHKRVTERLREHYIQTFEEHGPTPRGVDWGEAEDVALRYHKMLHVLDAVSEGASQPPSLLDVGCGYGGLYQFAKDRGIRLRYTGIDVAENMIKWATANIPDGVFSCEDVFDFSPATPFDYVVCSGILTQKLAATIREMDAYAQSLIKRMFELAQKGVAFNVMTSRVNFTVTNLYYKSPVEMLAFSLSEITDLVEIDHSYRLYEYTTYLYRGSR